MLSGIYLATRRNTGSCNSTERACFTKQTTQSDWKMGTAHKHCRCIANGESLVLHSRAPCSLTSSIACHQIKEGGKERNNGAGLSETYQVG